MVTVESLVENDAMGQCAAERNGDGLGVRAESSCGKDLGEPRSIPGDRVPKNRGGLERGASASWLIEG